MRLSKAFPLAALVAVLVATSSRADVKVPAFFSDGMVLQQGVQCPIWGTADPDEKIVVGVAIESGNAAKGTGTNAVADKDGKWSVKLPALKPLGQGEKCSLTIKGKNDITIKNVLIGEVWIASGQSNMEMSVNSSAGAAEAKANAKNPNLRLFTVKRTSADTPQWNVPRDGNDGRWLEAGPDTLGGFSAVGYYFGRDLEKARKVPVGIIHTSWGGTAAEQWTRLDILQANPVHLGKHPGQGKLYNGMIAPLVPYAIKGAIWYQGESNAGRNAQYAELMKLMITNWRDDWKQGDFPFLFVQLAPYMAISKDPTDTAWARLREAQLHTLKVKNTGMAVITDVGDEKDIHPKRKEQVGARLALAARATVYGEKTEYSGPMFDSMKIAGDQVILSFTHAGKGLEARDGELTGFTIAGEDRKFHNARAVIKGDVVVVSSDAVAKPVAVRFGWANYPVVNFFNKDGLPGSPFRTDDWPMMAAPKPGN
jgi:sialate O-acetylesterase